MIYERTHTGEKHYRCSFCIKMFAQNQDLKKHEKNNPAPIEYHTCDECGYILIDEVKMKKHKLKEHGSNFECQDCESRFVTREDLTLHLASHEARNDLESTFLNPSLVI